LVMPASSAIFAINSALFIVCVFILTRDKFRRFYLPTKYFLLNVENFKIAATRVK